MRSDAGDRLGFASDFCKRFYEGIQGTTFYAKVLSYESDDHKKFTGEILFTDLFEFCV
jgi:hypothetical protein